MSDDYEDRKKKYLKVIGEATTKIHEFMRDYVNKVCEENKISKLLLFIINDK